MSTVSRCINSIRIAIVLLSVCAPLAAQSIPRDQYYAHIPPMPRLVRQTEASERLKLCNGPGCSSLRDVAPLNGVDDGRDSVLLALGQRFSPVLRRNNFS